MWKKISRALAIAIVIASISAIPLANAKFSAAKVGKLHDYLSLTRRQKTLAWRDLHKQAIHQYGAPWFTAIDRWIVPPGITTKRVSRRADRDVPALRGYNFAIVKGTLLIVNPTDHAVAAVITSGRHIA